MKTVAIIESENKKIISSIIQCLQEGNYKFEVINNIQNTSKHFDLAVLTGFTIENDLNIDCDKIINIHPSLLPSFAENNALVNSFTSGIKVGGITIHEVTKGNFFNRIITQYPVLIGLDTHFEEYRNEILNISKAIYPKVIISIIENRIFDFVDLFSDKKCSGNCSSCSGCTSNKK